jgi:hypothetical protein
MILHPPVGKHCHACPENRPRPQTELITYGKNWKKR